MALSNGVKIGIGAALVLLVAVGGEGLYIHNRNVQDAKAPAAAPLVKTDPDDLVYIKGEHPMSLADEKALKGRTIWVSAGGQLDYYAYAGHRVDFNKKEGILLGAQKMEIHDAVVQAAPKAAAFRIPQGDGQVLLVFTLPDDPKAAGKEYAVAVGDKEGSGWNLLTDQIFFYDDPHKLFSYWKPEIWKSIDEHRAIVGMNERQVMLALGQVSTPHGDTIGDRTVDYDDQGHPKSVTYQGGKATAVRDE